MSRLGRGFPNNALMRSMPKVVIPITYDATGAGGTGANPSWSHTIAGNAIVVWVCTVSGVSTSGAKVGSTSMTKLASIQFYSGTGYLTVFGMLHPPTGNQTVSVTDSGAAANSVSYFGVSSFGTPVTNVQAGPTTSASITASSASGQMLAQAFAGQGNTGTSTFSAYNKTMRSNISGQYPSYWPLIVGDAAGASTVNFTATAPVSGAIGGVIIPLAP